MPGIPQFFSLQPLGRTKNFTYTITDGVVEQDAILIKAAVSLTCLLAVCACTLLVTYLSGAYRDGPAAERRMRRIKESLNSGNIGGSYCKAEQHELERFCGDDLASMEAPTASAAAAAAASRQLQQRLPRSVSELSSRVQGRVSR